MTNLRRYGQESDCYFVTTITRERFPYFSDPALCRALLDNLAFYRRHMGFLLHGYVIMPDHLHLLLTPRSATISDVMRNFKSYTAKQIRETLNVSGSIWQSRFHDRAVRTEEQFNACLSYIHDNPVRAGIVVTHADYEYSSYASWHGEGSPLQVDAPDGSRLGPRPTEIKRT